MKCIRTKGTCQESCVWHDAAEGLHNSSWKRAWNMDCSSASAERVLWAGFFQRSLYSRETASPSLSSSKRVSNEGNPAPSTAA